jgi:hypothetical protein
LEKEARIRELKEKLHQVNIDEGSLQSFKKSIEKFRLELEKSIIEMYTHLHMLQDMASTIIDHHNRVKTKLTKFDTIQEGMNNIDTWIVENMDTSINIYHHLGRERNIYLYSLEQCHQDEKREDKETTISIVIYSCLHKSSQELIKICQLSQLEELGKNLVVEEIVDNI